MSSVWIVWFWLCHIIHFTIRYDRHTRPVMMICYIQAQQSWYLVMKPSSSSFPIWSGWALVGIIYALVPWSLNPYWRWCLKQLSWRGAVICRLSLCRLVLQFPGLGIVRFVRFWHCHVIHFAIWYDMHTRPVMMISYIQAQQSWHLVMKTSPSSFPVWSGWVLLGLIYASVLFSLDPCCWRSLKHCYWSCVVIFRLYPRAD